MMMSRSLSLNSWLDFYVNWQEFKTLVLNLKTWKPDPSIVRFRPIIIPEQLVIGQNSKERRQAWLDFHEGCIRIINTQEQRQLDKGRFISFQYLIIVSKDTQPIKSSNRHIPS